MEEIKEVTSDIEHISLDTADTNNNMQIDANPSIVRNRRYKR